MRFQMRKLAHLILTCLPALAYSGDSKSIQITIARISGRSPSLYNGPNIDAKKVDSFILRKTVKWNFEGSSGEVLLIDVRHLGRPSCVLYMRDGEQYRPLGGNDFCTWKKNPRLVHHDSFSWIEFPTTPAGKNKTPVAARELTIHFNKASGRACVLGLPQIGFDDLRCPNDEAPESK
jgi:hypothetical protein